jgi:Ca2+-binding RTX toxin-like protein
VSYAGSNAGVTILISQNGYTTGLGGHAQGDRLKDIENLEGSDFSDVLWSDSNANILKGGAGNDNLSGFGGDDTLDGGAGTDTLEGGSGDDVFILDSADTATSIATSSVIIDFTVPASTTAPNVETESLKLTGTIDTIWIDQSVSVATGGLGTNDAGVEVSIL